MASFPARRGLIFVHRWLGVTLSLPFLTWFLSGIGIMYWGFPSVTPQDRLMRSAPLDAASIRFSPDEALTALRTHDRPLDLRLNTFDGRPVYRFGVGRDERVVFADTGEVRGEATPELMRRNAARWTSQSESAAVGEQVLDVDQWTVQSPLRTMKPLWKYSWPDGQQVYVAQQSGEVVQYTTVGSRVGAYLGPIPHWLYFTPLRKRQSAWSTVVIWSSGIATIAAGLGLVIALWASLPARRIPYRSQKRWHVVFGLIFGITAVTWAFSGMLSMDPFPALSRETRTGGYSIARRLRGPIDLAAFAARSPREALMALPSMRVKELELATVLGEPVYIASIDRGLKRIVPLSGAPRASFDRGRLSMAVSVGADVSEMDRYDAYYRDRRRERPLPVLRVRLHDADQTRYYIDPATAEVVTTYSSRGCVNRWLYHGLHSFDFPGLYDHRPLWDLIVLTFMLGGTALAVTAVILAWRVVRAPLD